MARFIALHFIALHQYCICGNLGQASLLAPYLLWYLWSVIFDVTIAKQLWLPGGSDDG